MKNISNVSNLKITWRQAMKKMKVYCKYGTTSLRKIVVNKTNVKVENERLHANQNIFRMTILDFDSVIPGFSTA